MIRIAISPAAYEAICATLPVGSVAVEAEANERGERLTWLEAAMVDPRTWGTHLSHIRRMRRRRFIPTHVGNAVAPPLTDGRSTVHPHARGERLTAQTGIAAVTGSSPRTWGTPFSPVRRRRASRFMPTHVGNAIFRI